MTDQEISKALALAIGWAEKDFVYYEKQEYIGIKTEIVRPSVRLFCYRWPAVIWPIAERYGCFPSPRVSGDFAKHKRQGYPDIEGWELFHSDCKQGTINKAKWDHYVADTAAKVVALAVIGGGV